MTNTMTRDLSTFRGHIIPGQVMKPDVPCRLQSIIPNRGEIMTATGIPGNLSKPHGGVGRHGAGVAVGEAPPAGGDGNVTSEQDGGGPILTQARLSLIFWGSTWTNAATSPTSAQFSAAIDDIVNGVWGTQLNQYHGIGHATVDQAIT